MYDKKKLINSAIESYCNSDQDCRDVPDSDPVPVLVDTIEVQFTGTKDVSCNDEYFLLSCGIGATQGKMSFFIQLLSGVRQKLAHISYHS